MGADSGFDKGRAGEVRFGGRRLGAESERMRLLVRVARLYHEHGVRQPQIAAQLRISQPRVSRLLKEAAEIGIVRTVVVVPSGVHALLEEDLERKYGVEQIIVVDAAGENHDVVAALGSAGATHLDATLIGGEHLGISSWSASLLATVEAMQRRPVRVAEEVVQLIGGVGKGSAQVQATRLAAHLADLTGAEPVFLPAPGLVGSPAARQALSDDDVVRQVVEAWSRLTTVLVGIGSLNPSPLLQGERQRDLRGRAGGAARARRGGRRVPALLRRGRWAGRLAAGGAHPRHPGRRPAPGAAPHRDRGRPPQDGRDQGRAEGRLGQHSHHGRRCRRGAIHD
ncbi:hypothetical protein GCM10020001_076380 [Nonomuraea salmonea]